MNYPRINKLGLKIIEEPYPHIPASVLNKALNDYGIDLDKFSEYFGINTVMMIEKGKYAGEAGIYPCDIELALDRMESGREMTDEEWD